MNIVTMTILSVNQLHAFVRPASFALVERIFFHNGLDYYDTV